MTSKRICGAKTVCRAVGHDLQPRGAVFGGDSIASSNLSDGLVFQQFRLNSSVVVYVD